MVDLFYHTQDVLSGLGLSPAEFDLLTLGACDHLIMDYGTYGFWAGFITGGNVFLPKNLPVISKYYLAKQSVISCSISLLIPIMAVQDKVIVVAIGSSRLTL